MKKEKTYIARTKVCLCLTSKCPHLIMIADTLISDLNGGFKGWKIRRLALKTEGRGS